MRTLALAAAFVVLFSLISSNGLAQTVQPKGVVQGKVLDELGNPVGSASVIAYPIDRGFTYVKRVSTEKDGAFTFEALPFGKYAIAAEKLSSFYPDTSSVFSGSEVRPPIVEISPDHLVARVTVRFPGKAAAIILSIRDSATGKETFACVKLERSSEPRKFVRISKQDTQLRVLIPANNDITLIAWYPGYLRQTYKDSLRLKPAEMRSVRVNLVNDPAARTKTKKELVLEEMKHVVEEGCSE